MNPFCRGQAVDNLENLSLIIAINLCLVASFPSNQAIGHWSDEIDGIAKALRRYNHGKKGRQNYNAELIKDVIGFHLKDPDGREAIEAFIAEKGLAIDALKFDAAISNLDAFVGQVLD